MKIVLLADSLGFGGAQRQIANLAVELKTRGHEVAFVRYCKDDFYLSLLEKANIEPITVESGNAISRLLKIRKTIKQLAPDVLISFMTTPNFCASVASIGKHEWKLIVSERIANNSAFLNKKSVFMKKIQAKYADAIVCNSKTAQSLWEKYYPETKNKLSTIYNIIDVPEIAIETQNDGKCRLLVAARYEREKNLDGMLKAVMLLTNEERDKLEIHWYGKSNVAGAAESVLDNGNNFIKENGLDQCVFLHPATDKIYPLMAESDFVSLFSHMEGLPNSIIEGMSFKKPIVMSTVSDYDVLVDESNGFLCDPNSPQSIADALRNAINTTQEQREKMGQCSYEKIQKICSREAVVAQWEALLE